MLMPRNDRSLIPRPPILTPEPYPKTIPTLGSQLAELQRQVYPAMGGHDIVRNNYYRWEHRDEHTTQVYPPVLCPPVLCL